MNIFDIDKKNTERDILNKFSMSYTDFPKGRIISSESPDFIIKSNKKTSLGIELMQLFPASADNVIDFIKKSIDKKEEKLIIYKKNRLNKYWLILYTDNFDTFGPFNITNIFEKWSFKTSFDDVFLFNLSNLNIIKLNI